MAIQSKANTDVGLLSAGVLWVLDNDLTLRSRQ